MMLGKFDLHLHTNASDGLLEPEQMVVRAAEAGLMCIAITDHDTTKGVARARAEGAKHGLPVIAGAELAAECGAELHILALGMDIDSPPWLSFTAWQQKRRAERNAEMLDRMEQLGLTLPPEYRPQAVPGEYGRMHMASGLVQAGYVQNIQQAFDLYLGHGKTAYVKRRKFAAPELIAAIKAAGGTAVLAHPGRMEFSSTELRSLVLEMKAQGLEGIEAYYPSHGPEEVSYYEQLAREANLVCTYGSDWHGYDGAGLAAGFETFHIPDSTYQWLECLIGKAGGFQ